MNIASLCRREVVGIDAQSTLRQAATLMCEEHVGSLVVVTGSEPPEVVGIVTDRDLAIEGLGRHDNPADLKVGHLAKSPPLAVESSASVAEAVAAMEKAGVRRLLVVDPDGGVIGLVAADDLLGAVAEELGGLARALRANIRNEQSQRKVFSGPTAARPVFPAFGTVAVQ
jgi:signal-transduction protein with cAMP-binding, CBS, and nucleotidyltransferase domain